MSPFVLLIVGASAILHTGWNFVAKRESAGGFPFYQRMLTATVLLALVPTGIGLLSAGWLPTRAVLLGLASGVFSGLYYLSLGKAYRKLDFSVAYPLIRAIPVLLLALGDTARGRSLPPLAWLGMGLASAGCLLSPLKSVGDLGALVRTRASLLWALLTALALTSNTLIDKVASEGVAAGFGTAIQYCFILYVVSWVVVFLACRIEGCPPGKVAPWRTCAMGSVFDFGGYLLVVAAYQLVQHASYVFAFRQLSILLGVGLAVWIGKEKVPPIRVFGVVLLLGGILLVTLSR